MPLLSEAVFSHDTPPEHKQAYFLKELIAVTKQVWAKEEARASPYREIAPQRPMRPQREPLKQIVELDGECWGTVRHLQRKHDIVRREVYSVFNTFTVRRRHHPNNRNYFLVNLADFEKALAAFRGGR